MIGFFSQFSDEQSVSKDEAHVLTKQKKKRIFNESQNTSLPRKPIKRVQWAFEEKQFIKEKFSNYLKKNSSKLPSLPDVRKAIQNHPLLRQRNPAAIKTWIRQNKE